MNWHERRVFGVERNLTDLMEVRLMMMGLPRDATGFAELERRINQKDADLRSLLNIWNAQIAEPGDVVEQQ